MLADMSVADAELSSTTDATARCGRVGRRTTMGSSNINFAGDFEKQLRGAVQSGLEEVARDMTQELDGLRRRYEGRPVDEIKPAVARFFRDNGGSVTDPELTEYAQAISDGTRIEFNIR
jgi:hypothetical protein